MRIAVMCKGRILGAASEAVAHKYGTHDAPVIHACACSCAIRDTIGAVVVFAFAIDNDRSPAVVVVKLDVAARCTCQR